MTLIFMNERIRREPPGGPVIRAVSGGRAREANTFRLKVGGRVIGRVKYRRNASPVKSHFVRAWIELDDAVEVVR